MNEMHELLYRHRNSNMLRPARPALQRTKSRSLECMKSIDSRTAFRKGILRYPQHTQQAHRQSPLTSRRTQERRLANIANANVTADVDETDSDIEYGERPFRSTRSQSYYNAFRYATLIVPVLSLYPTFVCVNFLCKQTSACINRPNEFLQES